MTPPNYSDFSAKRRTGSGTYGRGPLIKCGCRGIFSFLRHFFNKIRKISRPAKKFRKKISSPAFSICYCLGSSNLAHGAHGAGISLSSADVRFTPKSGHCRAALGCLLSARSGHRLVLRYGDLGGGSNQHKSQYGLNCPDRSEANRHCS
jgi:hypothetical protein